jgi:uncharacterized protein
METITPSSRILLIDALRGFALAGVALAHITEQYLAGPPPPGFMEGLDGLPDQILMGFISFFVRGKFFALFSILFGLSFSIQMASAEQRGENFSWRFLWRAALLFVIGYLHHLFYRGDILTIYAILAPFLIPFHRLSKAWVLGVMAICFLSLPRFITFFLVGNESFFGLPAGFQTPLEAAYYETVQNGSLWEVFKANADYGMKTKMNFQLIPIGRLYYTFGYFLLGLWLGRIGIFRTAADQLNPIKRALLWLLGLLVVAGILTGLTFSQAPQPVDFSHILQIAGINFFDWTNIAITGIILGGFILLYHKDWWLPKLNFFAPYGRMALTNYVLQSIIGTFLFFGWGLGWIGQLRSAYLVLIAIVLIALQVHFSKYWLKHYKYGPLEWLWRSATYWKWQPFQKG